jgi:hypothetical protein
VLGLCFGLGYGVVHRLLSLPPGQGFSGVQLFGVKPFPGTGLDTLRQRAGSGAEQDIRADLEKIERERKQRQEAKKEQEELARRQAELEQRERQEREQERDEERRLEAERDRFDAVPDRGADEPAIPISPLLPPDEPPPAPAPLLSSPPAPPASPAPQP